VSYRIRDTKKWLDEIQKEIIFQLPIENRKKLFRKTFYITVTSLAHILERHYYKIPRYPNAGKFTVSIIEILSYLRDAFHQPSTLVTGTLNSQRIVDAKKIIGFDRGGQSTNIVTIISDNSGRIITAFPGIIQNRLSNS